jgi:hypothetical protein
MSGGKSRGMSGGKSRERDEWWEEQRDEWVGRAERGMSGGKSREEGWFPVDKGKQMDTGRGGLDTAKDTSGHGNRNAGYNSRQIWDMGKKTARYSSKEGCRKAEYIRRNKNTRAEEDWIQNRDKQKRQKGWIHQQKQMDTVRGGLDPADEIKGDGQRRLDTVAKISGHG